MSKRKKSIMDYIVPIICAIISGILGLFAGGQLVENSITLHINDNETEFTSDKLNDLYEENLSLQNNVKKLTAELSYVTEQLKQQTITAETDKTKIKELESNYQALKEDYQQLEDEYKNWGTEKVQLETEKLQLEAEKEALKQEISLLISQNTPVQTTTVDPVNRSPQQDRSDSVLLCNLNYITGNRMILTGSVTDNMGNEQPNVISSCNNKFIINGQYQTLTGTMFISDRAKNYGKPHIKVYGDGDILYDMKMEPGDQPLDFSVDISDVQELEVSLYQNTNISECRINK